MHFTLVQRLVGVLLMLFSVTMLPPALVGIVYGEEAALAFVASFILVLISGTLIWLPVRRARADLRTRDGFLVVVLFWTVLGLFGAIPFLISDQPSLSFTEAVFESLSGLTTTGATVISGLDLLPKAVLYYRQQLQWLGGMGIIVLAVAILPMLGVGGMQLYRAETPGPMKDNKLTPRITETAKALWYIYLVLTISCAGAYWWAGMTPFDAISHSFSTVAIGGFSTHDASLGYFQSGVIDCIAMLFMVIAGINFALHFGVWRAVNPLLYLRDPEVRGYLLMLLFFTVLCTVSLTVAGQFSSFAETLRTSAFHVISLATTTGFTTSNYAVWPGVLPLLLVLLSCIGGCAGSTAGGMKMIRAQLVRRQIMREIMQLIHPQATLPVKLGGRVIRFNVMASVMGFLAAYVLLYILLFLLLMATGLDQISAFSAVAASLNNLGPGLGAVAFNCADVSAPGKWIMVFAMLLGRLELFSLLVLLTPAFWRR